MELPIPSSQHGEQNVGEEQRLFELWVGLRQKRQFEQQVLDAVENFKKKRNQKDVKEKVETQEKEEEMEEKVRASARPQLDQT